MSKHSEIQYLMPIRHMEHCGTLPHVESQLFTPGIWSKSREMGIVGSGACSRESPGESSTVDN